MNEYRRGQVSIIYLLITIAIAFILASGVFMFSGTFKSDVTGELSAAGLDNVAQGVENSLLDLKQLASNGTISANMTIKIPKTIGEQKYSMAGLGDKIEFRTIGNPSSVKLLKIRFWPSADIVGLADSGQGTITFILRNSTDILLR